MVFKRASIFLGVFLGVLSAVPCFGITPKQVQDIRYAKAISSFLNEDPKSGLKLLKKNLDGPFHFPTENYLAQYFFEKEEFTKSFRFYQHILRKTYEPEVVNYIFTPKLKKQFIEFIKKRKAPSGTALNTAFEVAEKYFEAYYLKIFPPEFSSNLLELSEKYFLICEENKVKLAATMFYLSKIYFERNQNTDAIKYLEKAKTAFEDNEEEAKQMGLRLEDIELLYAEALTREGYIDSGTLIMRSLYSRDDISGGTRNYIKTFLNELKTSYFNALFVYQVRNKINAHQLTSEDYSNFSSLPNQQDLSKKDALFHHRRVNLFLNQQLSQRYTVNGNVHFISEKPVDSSVRGPGVDQTGIDIGIKRYRNNTSFYGLDYHFEKVAGRNLSTLRFIQPTLRNSFSPTYYWLTKNSKWKITFPIEFRKYRDERSGTGLGINFNYSPILSESWFSPSYYGGVGRRSEGDNFSSSFYYNLGLSNSHQIFEDILWHSIADFYNNSNSFEVLSFNELTLSQFLTKPIKGFSKLKVEAEFNWRRRSFSNSTISSLEFALGGSYNF